jgi:hypothetical protein
MNGVVHALRPCDPTRSHRRIHRPETPRARHERRLRHLARMREWYATQRRGGKRDDHVIE